jgi:hypothetical protein
MICYAYDNSHNYFFCGASRDEVEKYLRPFLKERRKVDKQYLWDSYFCSTEELLDECLRKQNVLKTFHLSTYWTDKFIEMFDKYPDDDIYFVINGKQDEFYIVPFYCPIEEMWSSYDPFFRIDFFEFKTLLELSDIRVTIDNEDIDELHHYTNYYLLGQDRSCIIQNIYDSKFKCLEDLYNYIYPIFQDYEIFYGEFRNYFLMARLYLPRDFLYMDQMNIHLQKFRYAYAYLDEDEYEKMIPDYDQMD